MSFGGKLARGLLAGAAGYYGKVADAQAEDRRMDGALMREAALARLRARQSAPRQAEGSDPDETRFDGDIARLVREYGDASPDTHPGLFEGARKIGFDEASARLRNAHGVR